MTAPRNAKARGSKRFYSWRNENYWSVTTIIGGGVPKPALLPWGIKMVAEGACDHAAELPALVEKDRDAAVQMLKSIPWARRDRAADLGSIIHAATEAYVLGKPIPKWPLEAKSRMTAFQKFLDECEPTYIAAEASVYNRTESYAGTLDKIAEIHGRRYLIDTKTGKGVYPEVALQLAAYRFAEFIGLADGSEEAMQPVDACAVLHLPEAGEDYELIEVRADAEVFKAFLYVREVFRWQEETSKSVLGAPLKNLDSEIAKKSRPLADLLSSGVASGGSA
jgi:hypothetical protein